MKIQLDNLLKSIVTFLRGSYRTMVVDVFDGITEVIRTESWEMVFSIHMIHLSCPY